MSSPSSEVRDGHSEITTENRPSLDGPSQPKKSSGEDGLIGVSANAHSFNEWEKADLGDTGRKSRFLKLMGAAKSSDSQSTATTTTDRKGHSIDQTHKLNEKLEAQFREGMEYRLVGGRKGHIGLGFTPEEPAPATDSNTAHTQYPVPTDSSNPLGSVEVRGQRGAIDQSEPHINPSKSDYARTSGYGHNLVEGKRLHEPSRHPPIEHAHNPTMGGACVPTGSPSLTGTDRPTHTSSMGRGYRPSHNPPMGGAYGSSHSPSSMGGGYRPSHNPSMGGAYGSSHNPSMGGASGQSHNSTIDGAYRQSHNSSRGEGYMPPHNPSMSEGHRSSYNPSMGGAYGSSHNPSMGGAYGSSHNPSMGGAYGSSHNSSMGGAYGQSRVDHSNSSGSLESGLRKRSRPQLGGDSYSGDVSALAASPNDSGLGDPVPPSSAGDKETKKKRMMMSFVKASD